VPGRYLSLDVSPPSQAQQNRAAFPLKDLAIMGDNSTVSPSQSATNFGVILDNTLSLSAKIKAVTHSCRFMLYNIRRV
jgi:hypothetical protein